jgi:hypothetical protein
MGLLTPPICRFGVIGNQDVNEWRQVHLGQIPSSIQAWSWLKILMVATLERSFLYIRKLPISSTYTYEAP